MRKHRLYQATLLVWAVVAVTVRFTYGRDLTSPQFVIHYWWLYLPVVPIVYATFRMRH